jgi:hypothetical protein
MSSPIALRLRDEDRARTITQLADAYGAGQLSLAQYESRAASVYRVQSPSELAGLTADLVVTTMATARPVGAQRILAVFSGTERRGDVDVPGAVEVRAMFGSVELDYTRARFQAGTTVIDVSARFGNIEIDLPDTVRVEMDGSALLGNFSLEDLRPPELRGPEPTDRVVRITGTAFFANVEVRRTLVLPGVHAHARQ